MGLTLTNKLLRPYEQPEHKNFEHDPLALSWACYRRSVADNVSAYFPDLSSVTPIAEDFAKAEESRAFYRDRIMFDKIRYSTVSRFRNDLYVMLSTGQITSENIGMLYKIPYFYTEDTAKQNLKQIFHGHEIKKQHGLFNGAVAMDLTLMPKAKVRRFRRSNDILEFWLADQRNRPYMTMVAKNNPLLKLWESVFKTPCLDVRAYAGVRAKHHNIEFDYYQLSQIELR